MNSQVKSRQMAAQQPSKDNQPTPQPKTTKEPRIQPQVIFAAKRMSGPHQNLSQNSTPKGKKVVINQQYIQPQQMTQVNPKSTISYKEGQIMTAQQQQMLLFENRKRSLEQSQQQLQQQQQYQQIQSKSTKVSPQRTGTAPSKRQSNPLQLKLAASHQASMVTVASQGFDGIKQHQLNSMEQLPPQQQYRFNQNEYAQPANNHISSNYQYFELEGIPQALVSHTAGASVPIKKKESNQNNINSGSGYGMVGNSKMMPQPDEINMDPSMHQSFINLIYPSKSKKLMSNEAALIQAKEQLTGTNIPLTQHGHHHKSKSLYVGGSQNHQNVIVKPVSHQLAPKDGNMNGVQKVQQSSYKKQSSIFNYSQRFKELLSETMGDESIPRGVGGGGSVGHHHHHHVMSQQQSPNSGTQYQQYAQNHIMVNFNDIQKNVNHPNEGNSQMMGQLKKTFEKQQSHPVQYLTLNDPTAIVVGGDQAYKRSEVHNTIDYTQPSSQVNYVVKTSSHNTPNVIPAKGGSGSIVMQSKSKAIMDPAPSTKQNGAQLHQRKPSHPVTNNFMLELLQGPPPITHQQASFVIQAPTNQYAFHHHQIDLVGNQRQSVAPAIDQSLKQNQLAQYTQLQPVREKKQHQPTQSKIVQNNKNINGGQQTQPTASHHQRSASDYMNNHQQNQQENPLHQQSKLMKFLNSESYDASTSHRHQQQLLLQPHPRQHQEQQEDIIESFEYLDGTAVSHQQQPSDSQQNNNDSHRGSSFVQQAFSQMLYDGGQMSHSQRQQFMDSNKQQLLANSGGSAVNGDKNQTSSTIYHYRKMSLQQPPQSSSVVIQAKKSPVLPIDSINQIISGSFQQQPLTIEQHGYQKVSQKRGSSPSMMQQQKLQNNYINAQQVPTKASKVKPNTANAARDQHVQSPSTANGPKYIMLAPNQSQVVMGHHHTSSATSIVSQQQPQPMPQPQQYNLLHAPTNNNHNRSNSDLVSLQGQAIVKKQMLVVRAGPNIQPRTTAPLTQSGVQTKPKSEMITPRHLQQQQVKVKKGISTGSTPANVSIDLVKNSQRGALSKNGSTHNMAQAQPSTSLHKRKESYPQQQHTPRLQHSSPGKPKAPEILNKGIVVNNFNQAASKRYSMQNSPRQNQQNKQAPQQYNLSQQYQMFQQVISKKTTSKTEAVSPSNMGRSGAANIVNSKSGMLIVPEETNDEDASKKVHKRGVSDTEYLLNQIRNNINTLKAYQPYANGEAIAQQEQTKIKYEPENKKESIPKYKRDNLMLHAADEVQNYQVLATDPNMSPYSKDLSKLQKLIRFNFRKFNEPPATTSEFYRIGRVLGRGAFGKVNLAAHKLSEQLVAIKSINKEFLRSSKHHKEGKEKVALEPLAEGVEHPEKKKVMQEFAILKQSNHQSVVRLYDTFETSKHICFVMELCAGGDLLTYVRKRRKLSEEIAKYFFKQLIEGLAYLHHSKLIVHRDIKLDNILLDANGRIKIADFGVSRQVQTESERMNEQCGTPAYIAPEILKDKGYDGFKVDVWSAGVCLYAMLIGTVPFKAASMQELHHLIINGKYDINNPNAHSKEANQASVQQQQQQQTKLSEHATNLINQLLQVDPRKRLSAVEVLSHPWLKDCKEELDVFTQKEKDVIHKEYLAKNVYQKTKEANALNNHLYEDTEVIFTEHNLDTRTNIGSLLKNASTKSIILAPFNSTISELSEAAKEQFQWPDEIKRMIVHKRVLKFAPKVKDLDRQYEHNNNADLDNGVYNNVGNEDDPMAAGNSSSSSSSQKHDSQDSLKKSFKETELSSDDEKAELQMEEARRKQKMQQESELQEFEKQIKMKYVRYQEPLEIIDVDLVNQISANNAYVSSIGVYPKDYLLSILHSKEMNYATASYHLLLKKQQLFLKLALQV